MASEYEMHSANPGGAKPASRMTGKRTLATKRHLLIRTRPLSIVGADRGVRSNSKRKRNNRFPVMGKTSRPTPRVGPPSHGKERVYLPNDFTAAASSSFTSKTVYSLVIWSRS